MAPRARFELEPVCGRERSGSAQAKSRAKRGICLELRRQRFWKLAPRARFELEPVCGRERSEGSVSSCGAGVSGNWLPGLDSNLSRYACVSEARDLSRAAAPAFLEIG